MPRSDSLTIRVLLTVLVGFGPLSTDLYLPSMPMLVTVFGTDIATVQLTLSVFLIGFAGGQLLYGPLSDRFGRRPVLMGGVVLYLVASGVCALAQTVDQLIAARFIQALGASCGPVVARAVVRDVYGRDRAATVLAYLAMAMALGPAVGPMIGGFLTAHLGWRSTFLALVGLGVGALVAVTLLLAETNRHRDADALRPGRLLGNYARVLGDRRFLAYAGVVAGAYGGIFAFLSASSFVLIGSVGLSPALYGLSFGGVALGYMLGSFAAGRVSARLGVARMIRLGTLISLTGGTVGVVLAVGWPPSVLAVILPMAVYNFGAGLTLPNAMAGAVGPYPTMAGLVSSLLGFLQMAAAALAGMAVGHLHDVTAVPMMGAIAVSSLVAFAAHRLFVRS